MNKPGSAIKVTSSTDHMMVFLPLNIETAALPLRSGYWKLNTQLLEDTARARFQEKREQWRQRQRRYDDTAQW
jgi:hypothetical protein